MTLKTMITIVPCFIFLTQTTIASFQQQPVTTPRNSLTTSSRYHVGTTYMISAFPQVRMSTDTENKDKLKQKIQKEHPEWMCYFDTPPRLYFLPNNRPPYTSRK